MKCCRPQAPRRRDEEAIRDERGAVLQGWFSCWFHSGLCRDGRRCHPEPFTVTPRGARPMGKKKTVTETVMIEFALPSLPNFIRAKHNGAELTFDVADMCDATLKAVGEAWAE